MKKICLFLLVLLSCLSPIFAQQVDLDKKSGLITVDGKPLFYLIGKNRVLFQSDYSLENLKHQELAYLKAEQQSIYSPGYGYTTETFYSMTFTRSGNYCELHGLTGFSMFKALARNIAAARLIENDGISDQAERKFVIMNNGIFLKDPNGRGGYSSDDRMARDERYNRRNDRSGDNRYYDGRNGNRDDRYDNRGNGRDDQRDDNRYGNNRDDRYDNRGNGRDDQRDDRRDDRNYNDNGRNDQRDDSRYGNNRDDRNNDDRYNDRNNSTDQNDQPPLPPKVSIANNKIYDNDELIGTYTQTTGAKGDVTVIIKDMDSRKIATARRANSKADWQITLVDDTKYSLKYSASSPLVTLFTSLVQKQYL